MTDDNPSRDDKGRWLPAHTEPGPGRDSKYRDWMPDQAYRLALLGLTDREMAEAFGISCETYYVWRESHPAFSEQIENGRTLADARVADSLYKRATGMKVQEDRIAKDASGAEQVVTTTKQLAPDTRAGIWWLSVRQRGRGWAGPQNTGANADEHLSGAATHDLSEDERKLLEANVDALIRRRQNDDGAGRK